MSSDLKQNQSFDSRYRQLDKNRAESVVERIRCEKIYDDSEKESDMKTLKFNYSMCMRDIVLNKLLHYKYHCDSDSEVDGQQNRYNQMERTIQKALNEPYNTDIKYEQYSACVDIEYNCNEMFETVFYFTNKNCKVKHISNAKSKLLTNEICGICLDKHPVKDLVVTNCNHVMGKRCFENVCRSIHIGNEITPCPLCRQNVTQVCVYRRK